MAHLPCYDALVGYLDSSDKQALRVVSRAFIPPNPLSMQEQLMAMTLRANSTQQRLVMEQYNLEILWDRWQKRHEPNEFD
jgi:hypothetical protein